MTEEGAIFGAKRHLYGGIAPSNMKKFSAVYSVSVSNPAARLIMEFPDDTIIDGQLLATVAGCAICRREDTYPENEFDGFLFNVEKKDGICKNDDTSVVAGQTYYYAAFPYSTQGVYNRNPANRASVDVIEGQPPKPMVTFVAIGEVNEGVPQIQLSYALPSDLIGSDGEPVGLVAGAMVRRSEDNYPLTENDGDLVTTLTNTSGVFYDTDIEKYKIYYYTAFPYSTLGVYNREQTQANRTQAEARDIPKYRIEDLSIRTKLVNPSYISASSSEKIIATKSKIRIYSGAYMILGLGSLDHAESISHVGVCMRSDRFAQNYNDFDDDSLSGVNEETGQGRYWIDINDGLNSLEQDQDTLEWSLNIWPSYIGFFASEFNITHHDELYFSVFLLYNDGVYTTGISSANTWLLKSEDWVIPQPTDINLKYSPVTAQCFLSFKPIEADLTNYDYLCLVTYEPVESPAWPNKLVKMNESAPNFRGSSLSQIPATNFVYADGIVTVENLVTTIKVPSGYICAMVLAVNVTTDDTRFVPLTIARTKVSCSLSEYASTAAMLESQESISENQLNLMEAVADLYEIVATEKEGESI